MAMRATVLSSLFLLALLTACSLVQPKTPPGQPAPQTIAYAKTSFAQLPGWSQDNVAEAFPAFLKSCAAIAKKDQIANFGPDPRWGKAAQWQSVCAAAQNHSNPRGFFETHFTPVAVSAPDSLFTGYYEASLEGSRTKHGPFQTPVYARPADLLTADLGAFSKELKGKTIRGRVDGRKFIPYPSRAGIEAKAPPAEILAYVRDPIDLFFMQIQGSGRIALDDGSVLRVGYDEQNGHDYVPIGRVLKVRGELPDPVTMQSIRDWLAAHPAEQQGVMNENPSYIFFRKIEGGEGPIGAQGVHLTPLRSIAIDKSLYGYGTPFFIATQQPILNRLTIAQDTGGAIKGPVRADVFWGYGQEAEAQSGPMQSKGAYWLLLPNEVAAALQ